MSVHVLLRHLTEDLRLRSAAGVMQVARNGLGASSSADRFVNAIDPPSMRL